MQKENSRKFEKGKKMYLLTIDDFFNAHFKSVTLQKERKDGDWVVQRSDGLILVSPNDLFYSVNLIAN